MPNMKVGSNIGIAKADISFMDAGISGANTVKIFRIDGAVVSYVPGRLINGITGFENGKGYFLKMLTVADFTSFLTAPGDVVTPPGDTDILLTNFNGTIGTPPVAETGSFTTNATMKLDGAGGAKPIDALSGLLQWAGATVSKTSVTFKARDAANDANSIDIIKLGNTGTLTNFLDATYNENITFGTHTIRLRKVVAGVVSDLIAVTTVPSIIAGDVFVFETDAVNAKISINETSILTVAHGIGSPPVAPITRVTVDMNLSIDKILDT